MRITIGQIEILAGKIIKRVFGAACLDVIKAVRFLGPLRWLYSTRAIKKRELSAPKHFPYRLSVCAIMKDEGDYLQEWIEYHHLAGVEHFYLYDNGSTDNTHDILKPYIEAGLVDCVSFPIDKPQIPAYEDCVNRHMMNTHWLAFIDLDEFIVPVKSDDIKDLLPDSPTISQIVIDWLIFGSNGQRNRLPGPVIERFTKRGANHWLTKTIVNPRRIHKIGVHEHVVFGRTDRPDIDTIRIHHYHCKSWEEYRRKAAKGDVMYGLSEGMKKYQRECFDRHDLNEIEDTTLLDRLLQLKSKA